MGLDLHRSLDQVYSLESPRLAPGLSDIRLKPTPLVVAPMSKSGILNSLSVLTQSLTYIILLPILLKPSLAVDFLTFTYTLFLTQIMWDSCFRRKVQDQ